MNIIDFLISFMRWVKGDWWKPRRCGWPYPEGYATYNRWRKTILDTGLSKEQAIGICKELNSC